MPKCPDCPLRDHALACPAETLGVAALCRLATRPDYRPVLVRLAAEGVTLAPARVVPTRDPLPALPPRPVPRNPHHWAPPGARQLVLAHYTEDLGWAAAVPMPAQVYSHGVCPPHLPCKPLPANVGREADAFLTHLVERYHDLAACTYFVQGDGPVHNPDLLDRLSRTYTRPTTLTTCYRADFPSAAVKARDRWGRDEHGEVIRLGDAALFADRTPAANQGWLNAIWAQVFTCRPPTPWRYWYAATMAVPRDAITARPRAFWDRLRALVRAAGNPASDRDAPRTALTAWAVETLWFYLFSDPLHYPGRLDPTPPPPAVKRVGGGCKCGHQGAARDLIRERLNG